MFICGRAGTLILIGVERSSENVRHNPSCLFPDDLFRIYPHYLVMSWHIDSYVGICARIARGVVGKNELRACFGDGGGAPGHCRVVILPWVAGSTGLRRWCRCCGAVALMELVGFDGDVTWMSWPVLMPPGMPPAWLDRKHLAEVPFVAVFAAALDDAAETCADFRPFDGVGCPSWRRRFRHRAVENGFA